MATFCFHRLIMGRVETDESLGYLIFFTIMFIEWSSMFHTTFVLIAEFAGLPGRHIGGIFETIFKDLIRNHK